MSVYLDEKLFKAKPTAISTKGQGLGSRGGFVTGFKKPSAVDDSDAGVEYESDRPDKGLPPIPGTGNITGPTINPDKFKVSTKTASKIDNFVKALGEEPPSQAGQTPSVAAMSGPSAETRGQPEAPAPTSTPAPAPTSTPAPTPNANSPETFTPTAPLAPTGPETMAPAPALASVLGLPTEPHTPDWRPPEAPVPASKQHKLRYSEYFSDLPEGHAVDKTHLGPNHYILGAKDREGREQGQHFHFTKHGDDWHHTGVTSFKDGRLDTSEEAENWTAPPGSTEKQLPSKPHISPDAPEVDVSDPELTQTMEPDGAYGSASGSKKNGNWHGPIEITNADGTSSVMNYRNGSRHGTFEEFAKDGKRSASGRYVNGRLHGVHRTYDPEGKLAVETNYRHGKKHGHEAIYNGDGSLNTYIAYTNGDYYGLVDYNPDGSLLRAKDGFLGHDGSFRNVPHSLTPTMDSETGRHHELPRLPDDIAAESFNSNVASNVHPDHEPIERVPSEFHPHKLEDYDWKPSQESGNIQDGIGSNGRREYTRVVGNNGQIHRVTHYRPDGSTQTAHYDDAGRVRKITRKSGEGNTLSSHEFNTYGLAHGRHAFHDPDTGNPLHSAYYNTGRISGHAFTHDPATGEITKTHPHGNMGSLDPIDGVTPDAWGELDARWSSQKESSIDRLLHPNPDKQLYHRLESHGSPVVIPKNDEHYDHVAANESGNLHIEHRDDGTVAVHGVRDGETGSWAGIPHGDKTNPIQVNPGGPVPPKVAAQLPDAIRGAASHLPPLTAPPKDKLEGIKEFLAAVTAADYSKSGQFGDVIGHILMSEDIANGVDFAYKALLDGIPQLTSSVIHSRQKEEEARIRRERAKKGAFEHPTKETLDATKKVYDSMKGLHTNPDEVLGDMSHWSEPRHKSFLKDLAKLKEVYDKDTPEPHSPADHNERLKRHYYGELLDAVLRKHRDLGAAERGYYARHDQLAPETHRHTNSLINLMGHVAGLSEEKVEEYKVASREFSDQVSWELARSLANGVTHHDDPEYLQKIIEDAIARGHYRTDAEEEARKTYNKLADDSEKISKRKGYRGPKAPEGELNPWQVQLDAGKALTRLAKEKGIIERNIGRTQSKLDRILDKAAGTEAKAAKDKLRASSAEGMTHKQMRDVDHPRLGAHWLNKKPGAGSIGHSFRANTHPDYNVSHMAGDRVVAPGKSYVVPEEYTDNAGNVVATVDNGHGIASWRDNPKTGIPEYTISTLDKEGNPKAIVVPVDKLHADIQDKVDGHAGKPVKWWRDLENKDEHIAKHVQDHKDAQQKVDEANTKMAEEAKAEKEAEEAGAADLKDKLDRSKKDKPSKKKAASEGKAKKSPKKSKDTGSAKKSEKPKPEPEPESSEDEAADSPETDIDQALYGVLDAAGKVGAEDQQDKRDQAEVEEKEQIASLPEINEGHETHSGAATKGGRHKYHIYGDGATTSLIQKELADHADSITGINRYTNPAGGSPKFSVTSSKKLPDDVVESLELSEHLTPSHAKHKALTESVGKISSHLESLPEAQQKAAKEYFEELTGHSLESVQGGLGSGNRHFINSLSGRWDENGDANHVSPLLEKFHASSHMQPPEVQDAIADHHAESDAKVREEFVAGGGDPEEADRKISIKNADFGNESGSQEEEQLPLAARTGQQLEPDQARKLNVALGDKEEAEEMLASSGLSDAEKAHYRKQRKAARKIIDELGGREESGGEVSVGSGGDAAIEAALDRLSQRSAGTEDSGLVPYPSPIPQDKRTQSLTYKLPKTAKALRKMGIKGGISPNGVSYDPESKKLHIRFNNSRVYEYHHVPSSLANTLLEHQEGGDSQIDTFMENLWGYPHIHPYRRIGENGRNFEDFTHPLKGGDPEHPFEYGDFHKEAAPEEEAAPTDYDSVAHKKFRTKKFRKSPIENQIAAVNDRLAQLQNIVSRRGKNARSKSAEAEIDQLTSFKDWLLSTVSPDPESAPEEAAPEAAPAPEEANVASQVTKNDGVPLNAWRKLINANGYNPKNKYHRRAATEAYKAGDSVADFVEDWYADHPELVPTPPEEVAPETPPEPEAPTPEPEAQTPGGTKEDTPPDEWFGAIGAPEGFDPNNPKHQTAAEESYNDGRTPSEFAEEWEFLYREGVVGQPEPEPEPPASPPPSKGPVRRRKKKPAGEKTTAELHKEFNRLMHNEAAPSKKKEESPTESPKRGQRRIVEAPIGTNPLSSKKSPQEVAEHFLEEYKDHEDLQKLLDVHTGEADYRRDVGKAIKHQPSSNKLYGRLREKFLPKTFPGVSEYDSATKGQKKGISEQIKSAVSGVIDKHLSGKTEASPEDFSAIAAELNGGEPHPELAEHLAKHVTPPRFASEEAARESFERTSHVPSHEALTKLVNSVEVLRDPETDEALPPSLAKKIKELMESEKPEEKAAREKEEGLQRRVLPLLEQMRSQWPEHLLGYEQEKTEEARYQGPAKEHVDKLYSSLTSDRIGRFDGAGDWFVRSSDHLGGKIQTLAGFSLEHFKRTLHDSLKSQGGAVDDQFLEDMYHTIRADVEERKAATGGPEKAKDKLTGVKDPFSGRTQVSSERSGIARKGASTHLDGVTEADEGKKIDELIELHNYTPKGKVSAEKGSTVGKLQYTKSGELKLAKYVDTKFHDMLISSDNERARKNAADPKTAAVSVNGNHRAGIRDALWEHVNGYKSTSPEKYAELSDVLEQNGIPEAAHSGGKLAISDKHKARRDGGEFTTNKRVASDELDAPKKWQSKSNAYMGSRPRLRELSKLLGDTEVSWDRLEKLFPETHHPDVRDHQYLHLMSGMDDAIEALEGGQDKSKVIDKLADHVQSHIDLFHPSVADKIVVKRKDDKASQETPEDGIPEFPKRGMRVKAPGKISQSDLRTNDSWKDYGVPEPTEAQQEKSAERLVEYLEANKEKFREARKDHVIDHRLHAAGKRYSNTVERLASADSEEEKQLIREELKAHGEAWHRAKSSEFKRRGFGQEFLAEANAVLSQLGSKKVLKSQRILLAQDLFKADFKDADRQKADHDNSFNRHRTGVSPTSTPSDEEDDDMLDKSLGLYVRV